MLCMAVGAPIASATDALDHLRALNGLRVLHLDAKRSAQLDGWLCALGVGGDDHLQHPPLGTGEAPISDQAR